MSNSPMLIIEKHDFTDMVDRHNYAFQHNYNDFPVYWEGIMISCSIIELFYNMSELLHISGRDTICTLRPVQSTQQIVMRNLFFATLCF